MRNFRVGPSALIGGLVLVVCACAGATATTDLRSDTGETDAAAGATDGPAVALPSPDVVTDEDFRYEWRRLVTGPGGWVTGLVVHPSVPGVMYARTDVGGAYKWDAATRTWRQMLLSTSVPDASAERDDYQVESIAVSASDPSTVYLSVGSDEAPSDGEVPAGTGRVLRSRDGGVSWTPSAQSFFVSGNGGARQRAERLAVDPSNADRAFLGTRREGLWVTEDGAQTWQRVTGLDVPGGTSQSGVSFVTFDPSAGTANGGTRRIYVGVAGSGVFRSDDAGATWRAISDVADPSVVPQEGVVVDGRLFVAFNSPDLTVQGPLRSYDGTSWTDLSPFGYREFEWALAVDPADPDRMVVVSDAVRYGSVFYTTDGGRSWGELKVETQSQQTPWVATFTDGGYMPVGRLAFDLDSGDLWFAEGSGIWRADVDWPSDGGTGTLRWELDSSGIEQLVASDLITPPGGQPVSAVADFQGFLHEDLDSPPTRMLVDDRFAGGSDLDYSGGDPRALVWIGADYAPYYDREPRAAISSDGGRSWRDLPNLTQEMFGGNVAVSATDPENIVWVPSYFLSAFEYIDEPKGVFVTKDAGDNWTRLASVGGENGFHRLLWWFNRQALASDKVDGGVFYLLSENERFLVSTDGGASWQESAHAPPCRTDNSCFVYGQLRPSPVTAGEVWAGLGDGGLYRTTDRGASEWERLPGIDEARAVGFGAPVLGTAPAVYVYGRGADDDRLGVWRSADDGRTWELIARFPYGLYKSVNVLTGDLNEPGRVYVGFAGNGFVYGDDPAVR